MIDSATTSIMLRATSVGLPRDLGQGGAVDVMDRPWRSGFYKSPVSGPVTIGQLGLGGDGQADLINHGGVDKAVLAYAASNYPLWRDEFGLPEFPSGAFGENLTVDGVDESSVSIGDRWSVGSAILEVSQPRQPCWKLARRWRLKQLPTRVVETGRSGWYLRVIREGVVEAGRPITVISRPHPMWTVSRVQRVFYDHAFDIEQNRALAHLEVLADAWRGAFCQRASE